MPVIAQDFPSTPMYWNMLTTEPDVVGQGTWTRFVSVNYLYTGGFYESSSNDGDNFSVNFRCLAGTYTLRFNSVKGTSYGILDIDIDGVEIGSKDAYAAGVDYDNIEEISGIVISSGQHTIKFRIDGKHASSTDYFINLNGIYLQRTA